MFTKLPYLAIVGLATAIPTPDAADPITFLDITYKNAFPCDLTVGGDGNVYSYDPAAQRLIQVNTADNVVTDYVIDAEPNMPPASTLPVYNGKPYLPCAVRTAPDGTVYAVNGYNGDVLEVVTKKKLTADVLGLNIGLAFSDILPLSKDLYFTGNNSRFLVYSDGELTDYSVPAYRGRPAPRPFGLYHGSNGDIYIVTTKGRTIIEFDRATKAVNTTPTPNSKCLPAYIRAEADSTIYATCFNDPAIIAYDTTTGTVTSFATKGQVSQETVDSTGTLWLSSTSQTLLTSYNPTTNAVEEFKIPAAKHVNKYPGFTAMVGVTYLPSLNRIYFVQQKYHRIGYLQLSSGQ